mgnify:CR=1 FL=1
MIRTYRGSCHCGAVAFRFCAEPITRAVRCNCSLCIRRGAVISPGYVHAPDVEVTGAEYLSRYSFGDRTLNHLFCRACGVSVFSTVAHLPDDYQGPATIGAYRINLGCVDDLDVFSLTVHVVDGRSF